MIRFLNDNPGRMGSHNIVENNVVNVMNGGRITWNMKKDKLEEDDCLEYQTTIDKA